MPWGLRKSPQTALPQTQATGQGTHNLGQPPPCCHMGRQESPAARPLGQGKHQSCRSTLHKNSLTPLFQRPPSPCPLVRQVPVPWTWRLLWLKGHACALVPHRPAWLAVPGRHRLPADGAPSSSSPPSALVLSALMRTHQWPQECLRLTGREPASAEGCHHCAQGSPAGLPSPARLGRTLAYRWCKAEILTRRHSLGRYCSFLCELSQSQNSLLTRTDTRHTLTGHCRAFLCVCFQSVLGCSGVSLDLSVAAVPVSL